MPDPIGPFRLYALDTEESDWRIVLLDGQDYVDLDDACAAANDLVTECCEEARVRDLPTDTTVYHVVR